jgi:hypothetical protein
MKLPLLRRAIIKHHAFHGKWLMKCIAKNERLMESAVAFIELVSKDIVHQKLLKRRLITVQKLSSNQINEQHVGYEDEEDDSDDDVVVGVVLRENDETNGELHANMQEGRNKTFVKIAAIDEFVLPMMRLPTKLQDRLVSTEV